jgi:hypothetical protein
MSLIAIRDRRNGRVYSPSSSLEIIHADLMQRALATFPGGSQDRFETGYIIEGEFYTRAAALDV